MRIMKKNLLLIISFLIMNTHSHSTLIPYYDDEITIDGILDEPAWDNSTVFTEFIQHYPEVGKPATQTCEVRIWRNGTSLNFSVICYGPTDDLRMSCNIRDGEVSKDDCIEIHLDTFKTGESGYYFEVNPLNTQNDGMIQSMGRQYDNTWDGVWHSDVSIEDDCWTVEVSIPYREIKYPGMTPGDLIS